MHRKNLGRLAAHRAPGSQGPDAHRRSRGQALVELALIVPVLALLFLATLDLGRLFYSTITVTNAAREAALEATVNPSSYQAGTCDPVTSSIVCAAVNEARNSWVTVAPTDVVASCSPSCSKDYGNEVTVTVTGHFSLLTPLIASFTGGQNITLSSTAKADVIEVPMPVGTPTSTPTPSATPTPTPDPIPTPTPTPTPTPAPSPTPSPTPSCLPPFASATWSQPGRNDPVTFTSVSSPTTGDCAIFNWRWEWGHGGSEPVSNGYLPTVSHSFPGKNKTYTVTLTVTNPYGTTTTYLTVTTLP